MCYVIDSKHILANLLMTRSTVSVKQLKSLASRIAKTLPEVAVDVSHYSLSSALETFPNMFQRQDEITITRTPCSQECFREKYVNVFFNDEIPPDIRSRFLDCITSPDAQHAES